MRFCNQCRSHYPNETQYCPLHGELLTAMDDFVPGAIVLGRYEILQHLGSGAMADVFLIRDDKMKQYATTRAMKVPNARFASDSENLRKFEDEANKAILLNHKYIVRSFHLDATQSGLPLLLMEFVEGESLRWWMDRDARLQWWHAVEIASQVAEALESAHADGIVHCDIKPENVKSTNKKSPTPLKVLDFGLGKATNVLLQKMTEANRGTVWAGDVIAGTYEYMSPEQAVARDQVGPPSDVYSLGVVLYEMLAGTVPFAGISSAEEARRIHQDRKPPSLDGRKLPPALVDLVARMLSRSPDARPTATEVMQQLRALPTNDQQSTQWEKVAAVTPHTAVEPPPVPKPPVVNPPPKPGRNVLLPVMLTIAAVLLLAAGAFFFWPKPAQTTDAAVTHFEGQGGSSSAGPAAAGWKQIAAPNADPGPAAPSAGPAPAAPSPHAPEKTANTQATAALRVSCDLACTWKFDGATQGRIEAGAAVTVNAPVGKHTVDATPEDTTVEAQRHSVTIAVAQANSAQFSFGPDRAARGQQVSEALSRAEEKRRSLDYSGALAECDRVLRLDRQNSNAQLLKQQILKACEPIHACS